MKEISQHRRENIKKQFKSWINITLMLAWVKIKVRYKNSILGVFWSLITPLIFLGIFIFIFSQAFSEIENYPLFALSGLIFWNFFSTTTSQIADSVIGGAGILKSIPIPPIIFPVSALIAALLNLLFSLVPFTVIMLLFGQYPNWNLLALVPAIFLYACFALGVSLLLAALNVYMRDVLMFWSSIIPGLLYCTPIAYPIGLIPEEWQWLMNFNPLFHYITAIRKILYYSNSPNTHEWLSILAIAVISLSMGVFVFQKLQRNFISAL